MSRAKSATRSESMKASWKDPEVRASRRAALKRRRHGRR
jgi:hypothetical protein